MVVTFFRSFYDRSGARWVGLANYQTLFSTDFLLTALKNNALWVAVVPAVVTALGLIFAVLTERVSWSVAFRTIVFMPMAISLFAAGIIWRIAYEKEPDRGVLNASIAAVHDVFDPPGRLAGAAPSTNDLRPQSSGALAHRDELSSGDVAVLGLTQILTDEVPKSAAPASRPAPIATGIRGVVWRDFRPGGGTPGAIEKGELGLPDVVVELRDQRGDIVAGATTARNGAFTFEDIADGEYVVAIAPESFSEPFGGISWLGEDLITPAIMVAYTWVWAGFALVIIAAGLTHLPRELLEAARIDGANEWQVFRNITVPLLAPVLTVVFVTMLINVLKVFDIVLAIAPASAQDDANVIALAMWRTAFGGARDFGLGSAIAVFLLLLVLPALVLNVRRFRRETG
ncbi:MAG: ABC transporter permease subunit [Actinomycetota bacterium]|nr:ABC transporter permease subunit [Actinomycetota bacterium]